MNATIKNRIGNCRKYIRESMEYVTTRKDNLSPKKLDFDSCEIIMDILNSVNITVELLLAKAIHEYNKDDLSMLGMIEFKLQIVRIMINNMESIRRWSLT
jgi:hypothetical protein